MTPRDEIQKMDRRLRVFRVDTYLVPVWQAGLNLALGAVTVAFLAIGMFSGAGTTLFILSLVGTGVGAAVLIGFNLFLRLRGPMSFTEFVVRSGGHEYVFQIFSARRAAFYDGGRGVEVDRGRVTPLSGHLFEFCRYNSYLDGDYTAGREEGGTRIFEGCGPCEGRSYRRKLTLAGGLPLSETVGGARKRFCCVNDDDARFTVPAFLESAAREAGLTFPDLKNIVIPRLKS